MLFTFPAPYPDELLYSVFARYHLSVGNYSAKHTTEELFRKRTIRSVHDLPSNINIIVERLNNPYYSSEYLIQNHTMFPYYNAFLLPEQGLRVKTLMKGNYGERIHTTSGIAASNIKIKEYFMHCSQCVQEDYEIYGETYWHRTHQLPGVLICHKHGTVLHETSVPLKPKNQHEYVIADEVSTQQNGDINVISNEDKKILFKLSQLSYELLHSQFTQGKQLLYKEYKYRLMSMGMCSLKGHVDKKRLYNSFQQYYSVELLNILQSPIEELETNWLSMIFQKHRKSFHPIRHLLVMIFFNDRLENFFSNSNRAVHPFGNGPWYCLNPVCVHYRNKVVTNLIITRDTKTKKPVGTFTCECGFIYSRSGPDKDEMDNFRVGQIKDFGYIWKEKLQELILNDNSLNKISKILKCDPKTVKRQAALLQISFSGNDKYLKNIKERNQNKQQETMYSLGIENKENEWKQLQEQYPDLTITELRSLRPDLYAFLYRTSRDFLIQNTKKGNRKSYSNKSRVDWKKRDKELLKEVIQAVEIWDLDVEKLTRITLSSIGKKINKLSLLEKNKGKLPSTMKYIEGVVEDVETFQIRRLHWAKERMIKEGEEVVAWKLIRKAGLKDSVTLKVKKELSLLIEEKF